MSTEIRAMFRITDVTGADVTLTRVGETRPLNLGIDTLIANMTAAAPPSFWGPDEGPERYEVVIRRFSG